MIGLTEKQQSLLDFIESFIRREGMAPTIYEIGEYFDIKPATAFAHLRALHRKGYVTRTSKARSLSLVRSNSPRHLSLTISVPILGRISAGAPLLAEAHIEDTIQLDPKVMPRGTGGHPLFGLRVNGESMRDLGILDGDIVISKAVNTASIGSIVVALVGDETTVKRFYVKDGRIELRPANSNYPSRFFDPEEVFIQGVVIALHRSYN